MMEEKCMSECSSKSTCGKESCEGCRKNTAQGPQDMHEAQNPASNVKKVIGVVSGKGGVGKSLVTSLLAVAMRRKGYQTAILDADITGPSIPKAFGLKGPAMQGENGILPIETADQIRVMSLNLLLEDETDPVVWRGPVISGTVKQFWTDVCWGDVDYMFVDMPPGTGDVALTVFQSLPLAGIVIVTTPQDLVSMIVTKAVKMAELMQVPVLGIVENMSYFECPDCKKRHYLFGQSNVEEVAAEHGIAVIERLPMDPSVAALCDLGRIEQIQGEPLAQLASAIE
jgi:Mrp family chromosome partitioning ATPase